MCIVCEDGYEIFSDRPCPDYSDMLYFIFCPTEVTTSTTTTTAVPTTSDPALRLGTNIALGNINL